MPRYCVIVTRPKAFFVDADSMVEASELAVDWEKSGARPAYSLEAETDAVSCVNTDDSHDGVHCPVIPVRVASLRRGGTSGAEIASDSSTGLETAKNEVPQ